MDINIKRSRCEAELFVCHVISGDISKRFLDYTRSQHERQQRRGVRSQQTLSWQEISNDYSHNDEQGPVESTAVVCDINKEMLKVGKDKAENTGYSSGRDGWPAVFFVFSLL